MFVVLPEKEVKVAEKAALAATQTTYIAGGSSVLLSLFPSGVSIVDAAAIFGAFIAFVGLIINIIFRVRMERIVKKRGFRNE